MILNPDKSGEVAESTAIPEQHVQGVMRVYHRIRKMMGVLITGDDRHEKSGDSGILGKRLAERIANDPQAMDEILMGIAAQMYVDDSLEREQQGPMAKSA